MTQCLRDNGWELASHSWGHINFGKRSFEDVKTDSDKWASRVESPDRKDGYPALPIRIRCWRLASVHNGKNEKTHISDELGFRYFCNVDSSQYWVQFGSDYLRQGRRTWTATACTTTCRRRIRKRPLKRPLRCDPGLRPRTAGSGGTDELDLD